MKKYIFVLVLCFSIIGCAVRSASSWTYKGSAVSGLAEIEAYLYDIRLRYEQASWSPEFHILNNLAIQHEFSRAAQVRLYIKNEADQPLGVQTSKKLLGEAEGRIKESVNYVLNTDEESLVFSGSLSDLFRYSRNIFINNSDVHGLSRSDLRFSMRLVFSEKAEANSSVGIKFINEDGL